MRFGELEIEIPETFRGCKPGHEVELLASSAELREGRRMAELGCGIGVLTLRLAQPAAVEAVGFEIQAELAEAARQNGRRNASRLRGHAEFVCADIRRLGGTPWEGRFDTVFANPPFHRAGTGRRSPNRQRDVARHEGETTLADFVRAASILLRPRGRFYFIVRPDRLPELLELAAERRCPINAIVPVYTRAATPAEWVIAEGVKGGRGGFSIAAARFVQDKGAPIPT
ncbi:MAG: methyltransferase [Candidatus Sumerlaeia bacterium]|nr:methyltransferase [Candidatus Sumerlaeia bacterium]